MQSRAGTPELHLFYQVLRTRSIKSLETCVAAFSGRKVHKITVFIVKLHTVWKKELLPSLLWFVQLMFPPIKRGMDRNQCLFKRSKCLKDISAYRLLILSILKSCLFTCQFKLLRTECRTLRHTFKILLVFQNILFSLGQSEASVWMIGAYCSQQCCSARPISRQ